MRSASCVPGALAALVAAAPLRAAEDPDWHVDDASLRYTLSVVSRPTHPGAGCIAVVPDGGLLPSPLPELVVTDGGGQPLPCACLWHDPRQGLAVVFRAPEERAGPLALYVRRGGAAARWTPASGLTPGVIAFTRLGATTSAEAHALARNLPAGEGILFTRLDAMRVRGIPPGYRGGAADYVLGHVTTVEQGQTWVALETPGGSQADLVFRGEIWRAVRLLDVPGGCGQWLDAFTRPNLAELFAFRPSPAAEVELQWRPPGSRKSDLYPRGKAEGQPPRIARPLRREELALSGEARVEDIAFRDGAPAAAVSPSVLGFTGPAEAPLVLVRVEAIVYGPTQDTALAWDFDAGRRLLDRSSVLWLFSGSPIRGARLAVTRGGRTTRLSRAFLAVSSNQAPDDISSEAVRSVYGEALLNMMRAAPPAGDPFAPGPAGAWNLLLSLPRRGEAAALLEHLFTLRWDALRSRVSQPELRRFEDLFFSSACLGNPRLALEWADRFSKAESDDARRQQWKLKRGELLMYYMDDPDTAEKFLRAVSPRAGDVAVRAAVRLGDLALLRGNREEALRLYSSAARSAPPPDAPPGTVRALGSSGTAPPPAAPPAAAGERAAGLAAGARALIRRGDCDRARELLDAWEIESPADRILGEFIPVEAELLTALKDFRRADSILGAYCRLAEVSDSFPEAVRMKLQCMRELGMPEPRLAAFQAEMDRRLGQKPAAGKRRK